MSKEQLEDKIVEFRQLLALGHVNMDVLNKAHEIHELVIKQSQQNKRYREVVTQAISDLENECLWDALVKLKALEAIK